MQEQHITKAEMAKRMCTSRAQSYRCAKTAVTAITPAMAIRPLLKTKTTQELRELLEGSRDRENAHAAQLRAEIEAELALRGEKASVRRSVGASTRDEHRAESALAPFIAVSKSVQGNRRTAFTAAGGLKLQGRVAVDVYTAIKCAEVNVILVAFAQEKRGDLVFSLIKIGDKTVKREVAPGFHGITDPDALDIIARAEAVFTEATLPDALPTWKDFADQATAKSE